MYIIFETIVSAFKNCICSPFWWAIIISVLVCLPASVGVEMATSKKELIIYLIFFLIGIAYLIIFFILNTLGVWVI